MREDRILRGRGARRRSLLLPSLILTVGASVPPLPGAPGEEAGSRQEEPEPACITWIIDGMLKSKSGAT